MRIKRKKFGGVISRQASKRSGQGLRGTTDSATRLDETGKKVRMSKESNVPVMQEVASPKGRKAAAKKQNTPAAKAKRKAEGKVAADLKQPAAGSVGKGAEQADAGIPEYQATAFKTNKWDKALARKEKRLEEIEKKLADMTAKANTIKDRKKKIKYVADRFQKRQSLKTEITDLKASIKDMKSRGGPGGRTKIKYKKKQGGQVSKRKGGGQVYKRKKGGSTKKKVSGNDGNAVVAACYD